MERYVYLGAFVIGFFMMLRILLAIHLETQFKRNHVFEIRMAYILFSILGGHLFAEFLLKIISFIPTNL